MKNILAVIGLFVLLAWLSPEPLVAPAVTKQEVAVPVKPVEAYSLAKAVEKVMPSVVCLEVMPKGRTKPILGTGVVVDEAGTILTCNHMVGGEDVATVILPDGKKLEAGVFRSSVQYELALLRVEGEHKWQPVTWGNGLMKLGQEVALLGNPYGYRFTLTRGVVSGLNRNIEMLGRKLPHLLQTDAAVNPGNSGGPMFTPDGSVVGIVVAMRDGAENIGFVLSADQAQAFINVTEKKQ